MNWGGVAAVIAVVSAGISTGALVQSTSTTNSELQRKVDELSAKVVNLEKSQVTVIHNSSGTISVNDTCFKPRTLVRCRNGSKHMTWVDNLSECSGASYIVEGQVLFLAQCN